MTRFMLRKRILRKLKEMFGLGSRPDFFIVGAQKCGTTSLYDYLVRASRDIVYGDAKEHYFFTENEHLGERFYHSFFPVLKGKKMVGDATPDYLFYHQCPKKIYKYNSGAKIIIILRDPVKRAFSQYAHQNYTWKTKASDPLSFSQAIREEESRYHVENLTKFYYEYKHYSYKARGLYYNQISNWLRYFSESNIHIIFLEDLEGDVRKTLQGALSFLGAKDNSGIDDGFGVKNKSPDSQILEEDEKYLREFFREDSEKLFKYLGATPKWKWL